MEDSPPVLLGIHRRRRHDRRVGSRKLWDQLHELRSRGYQSGLAPGLLPVQKVASKKVDNARIGQCRVLLKAVALEYDTATRGRQVPRLLEEARFPDARFARNN